MNLRKLAVLVLNDDHGISYEAFEQLLECLSDDDAVTLRGHVDACEGRFYLPKDHTLGW
jgi:hypothetical protein